MTSTPQGVVVPYERFVECRARRQQILAEFAERPLPETLEGEILSVRFIGDETERHERC